MPPMEIAMTLLADGGHVVVVSHVAEVVADLGWAESAAFAGRVCSQSA